MALNSLLRISLKLPESFWTALVRFVNGPGARLADAAGGQVRKMHCFPCLKELAVMSVPERYPQPLESSPPREDAPPQPGPVAVPPIAEETLVRRRRLRRPLPLWLRILVLLVGW